MAAHDDSFEPIAPYFKMGPIDPKKIDILLYRVQFAPIKFKFRGLMRFKWFRKLAYKLGWKNKGLVLRYSGAPLEKLDGIPTGMPIGRLKVKPPSPR